MRSLPCNRTLLWICLTISAYIYISTSNINCEAFPIFTQASYKIHGKQSLVYDIMINRVSILNYYCFNCCDKKHGFITYYHFIWLGIFVAAKSLIDFHTGRRFFPSLTRLKFQIFLMHSYDHFSLMFFFLSFKTISQNYNCIIATNRPIPIWHDVFFNSYSIDPSIDRTIDRSISIDVICYAAFMMKCAPYRTHLKCGNSFIANHEHAMAMPYRWHMFEVREWFVRITIATAASVAAIFIVVVVVFSLLLYSTSILSSLSPFNVLLARLFTWFLFYSSIRALFIYICE